MKFFEINATDISNLNDADLRELVGRLCEAEVIRQGLQPSCVFWGGAQEAADGGIDVRVSTTILSGEGFIPRKDTGFQVKKNSMSKAACKSEMLKGQKVKPVIAELALGKGAYIIVSGKDSCSETMLGSRINGMTEAVKSLPQKSYLVLDFYGSDRLATWLRQFPGVALWVRSKLGKSLSGWHPFNRWAMSQPELDDEFLVDEHPCITDSNSQQKEPVSVIEGIRLVREKLRHEGSVVRIIGLSGVGKTRFAQALFEANIGDNALPVANVIYADLGDDLKPTASELTSYLIANNLSAHVVLDNCSPDVHRQLQQQISREKAKLSLLTIEYDISDDRPEETTVIHIEPSSEALVSQLIQKRFPDLGQVNAGKVAEFAGGNARLAIALAGCVGSDDTLINFSDEDLFLRLFQQRKGESENLLKGSELLSLVYSFNVNPSELNDELKVLANIGGFNRRDLHRHQAELLRRQLSQQRGNWRAVLPHALANRLTRRVLQNITPSDINRELFTQENLRLFKSCAHRLGYLHDFEPARNLALSWLKSDAPLCDIAKCDSEHFTVFEYITPIFPEIALSALEDALSRKPEFFSRGNHYFSRVVRLLKRIAYDDELFDRAARLIFQFAETEKAGENFDSVLSQFKSLFFLYISGTNATPKRRQNFLSTLLVSDRPRYLEIACELFHAAFETSWWSSADSFDFGARKRGHGWQPKIEGERLSWYTGFIGLLKPFLESSDNALQNWSKGLLAKYFNGLWSYAGCFDILEEIIETHAKDGCWLEMHLAIKKTLHRNADEFDEGLRAELQELECISAPQDLYQQIEFYVLTNTWEHDYAYDRDAAELDKKIKDIIIGLGKQAASNSDLLKKVIPRLLEKNTDTLFSFGKGLALGSEDQGTTFDFLVQLMQKQKPEVIQPSLFEGFINGVYSQNKSFARGFQERILEIKELKPFFVNTLMVTPIDPWGVNKLIELVSLGELEAWRFIQIGYGRAHESISDVDLSKLLEAVKSLEQGCFSVIEILKMRFLGTPRGDCQASEALLSIGRAAILKLLQMPRDNTIRCASYAIERVAESCLVSSTPDTEVVEIVESLCECVEVSCQHDSELHVITNVLVKRFSEVVLNRVFEKSDKGWLADCLFKPMVGGERESILNLIPIERLLKWCGKDQGRILKIAGNISTLSFVDIEAESIDASKQIKLSQHILALLDAAEDKSNIIEIIYGQLKPRCWGGSEANIIEKRSQVFSELLPHPSPVVRDLAQQKLKQCEQLVRDIRRAEAEENTKREQRFE